MKPIPEVEVFDLPSDAPPKHAPKKRTNGGWFPDLNPTQELIFNDASKFLLAEGPKGSGKSAGLAHGDVRHSYENKDALTLLISPSMRSGQEGIWHDLMTLVIPAWSEGIGLEHSDSKIDPNTKDRHIWIGNVYGGWSKILLMSVPSASQVEARIKGPAPSRIHVEELTDCDGRQFFDFPAAQLNRRRNIQGPQQYTASCNPKGPSNWVYKLFHQECIDKETGQRDPDYAVHHVPILENVHRLPPGYFEGLKKIFATNPTEYKRLILGQWIDVPPGDAMFKEAWRRDRHMKGNAATQHGLLPIKGYPIYVGHDPGPVNYCATFLQFIPMADGRVIVLLFDELNYVGKREPFYRVVPQIVARMNYWNERIGSEFVYVHVADEASFNQLRNDGKYDYQQIEKLSVPRDNPEAGPRIKLRAAPKGNDSVPARVNLVMSKLMLDEMIVSATCVKSIEMFENLQAEKEVQGRHDTYLGFRPMRSVHLHPFDAMSYPIFYYTFGGASLRSAGEIQTGRVYTMGGR